MVTPTPIYQEATIPESVVKEVENLKSDAAETITKINKEQEAIHKGIEEIKNKVNELSQESEDQPDIPIIPETDFSKIIDERITQTRTPLILTSIISKEEIRGVNKLTRMLRKDPNNRVMDEIHPEEGLRCVNGTSANFTFWSQFPTDISSIEIDYPYETNSKISIFKVVGYLESEPVCDSGNFTMEGTKTKVTFGNKPVKIKTFTLYAFSNAGDEKKICIGNVTAVSPSYIHK
ncbi:hypothetical protein GPJ56_010236 [Histomonas meleagridis]|uniref:uncharacterized protein n=1 Tax=Histomonas meleagridis TaxID=135588 RepID=UPI00355AB20E|nr:hypothetical protein GPJ56_010236 [Histomonas meleagridis]KAH0797104.1 hypothetical protein GO595_010997 [Histomonas meleagridis]